MSEGSSLNNTEAEALVLAGILRSPDRVWDINTEAGLTASDFLGTEARRVFKAVEQVLTDRHNPELPYVLEVLRSGDHKSTLTFVEKLMSLPCSVEQANGYAMTVKRLAVSRAIVDFGAKAIEVAEENRADIDSAITDVERLWHTVLSKLPQADHSPLPADILAKMRGDDATPILLTFMPTLTELTGGLVPGQLWVIGGYSSTGKSAVAVNFAAEVLQDPTKWVGMVSTEMSAQRYMLRLLSLYSGVPQRTLRMRLPLSNEQQAAVRRAEEYLSRANLRIWDTVNRLSAIRSQAVRMKEQEGLNLLIVDFIQNVKGSHGDMSFGDMTEVIQDVQQLAKELDITVLVLSQLTDSQQKYMKETGDTEVYSFKGSGAIKDAADVAVILERERTTSSPLLVWRVVKNRDGELNQGIDSYMELPTGRIQELTREDMNGDD